MRIGLAFLIAATVAPAPAGPPADAPTDPIPTHFLALQYAESSSGLTPPQFEGGMTELEFADVNGDGNVDIVSIGDHGNPQINSDEEGLMVWFGNGAGSWTYSHSGQFGYGGIALGDINGDGTIDAAYGMHHNYSPDDFGDQLIEAALGDGTGLAWTPWDDGLATNGEDYGMFATDLADIDNDGDLDLACLSFGCCNGFHVYVNNGNGTWTQTFAVIDGNSTTNEIVFGDVNGDGNADFAAGYQNGSVWLGDGMGGFTLADGNLPAAGSLGRAGTDLADVDGDGKQDLSFANSSGGVEVWLWRGNNTWLKASTGLPATGPYETTQMDDMDGDGRIDVVGFGNRSGTGSGSVTVWTGNGGSSWTQASSFTVGTPGYAQALRVGGDADHSGRPDIALVEEERLGPFSYKNKLKFYKETTPAASLSIRATYPRGGETFLEGSVRFVEWASGVPAGWTSSVTLEFSSSGAGGPWTLIASGLPNNGRYQWSVPPGAASTSCYVRATVTSPGHGTAVATTPAAFTIAGSDSDGDGVPNGQDCAPADPGSHHLPQEVSGLGVRPDPGDPALWIIATWDSQAVIAGDATVYDLITGPVSDLGPDGVLDLATCRADDLAVASSSVALPVPAGAVHYILVRAQNACGTGIWGRTTAGSEFTSSACGP